LIQSVHGLRRKEMEKTVLGKTGLAVFPLIFGTLPLGPLQAGLSAEEGGALIRHALELGVDMLDTAELYETYAHVREALCGYPGEVIVATKTHAAAPGAARSHVERALRELGRERLDVVHLHAARIADPFVERAAVLDELLRMKEEGKIAHVGLSSHYVSAVKKAAGHPEIELVHPLINRTGMGIIDGTAPEMAEAIVSCAAAGKGIYAMKALAGGNLISSARESLRYSLSIPGVAAVAVGMLSREEVEANVALFSGEKGEDGAWRLLEEKRRRLRIMERFCKGCGACIPACTNAALRVEEGTARVDEESCILCGYCAAACPEFLIRVV
jgi:uncharacterized protein